MQLTVIFLRKIEDKYEYTKGGDMKQYELIEKNEGRLKCQLKWKEGIDPSTVNIAEQLELAKEIAISARRLREKLHLMLKQNNVI